MSGGGVWADLGEGCLINSDPLAKPKRVVRPVETYIDEAGNRVTVLPPGYAVGAEPGPTARGRRG